MLLEDKLMENYVATTQIVMVLFQPLKMDCSVCMTSLDAHFPFVFFINTIVNQEAWYNSLTEDLHNDRSTVGSPLAGKLLVVIGAGGSGKSLAYGAKEKGARVVIANRTYGKNLMFSLIKRHLYLLCVFIYVLLNWC